MNEMLKTLIRNLHKSHTRLLDVRANPDSTPGQKQDAMDDRNMWRQKLLQHVQNKGLS